MKHNFWTGLLIFLIAYFLMHLAAITLLGSVTYNLIEWPVNTLSIFMPFYLVAAGYGLTQAQDLTRFEYAKDIADGILLTFLGHYIPNWGFLGTLVIFMGLSIAYRFTGSVIKITKDANQ